MRVAEGIEVVYFLGLVVLAWWRPLPPERRRSATAMGLAALALVTLGLVSPRLLPGPASEVLRDWLPAPLMVLAYWQAGKFFLGPLAAFQAWLVRLDERLLGRSPMAPSGPRAGAGWLAGYLEIAYLLCYPLPPLGLAVLYLVGREDRADAYWAAVLVPSYVCYLLVTCLPTLPPRLLPGSSTEARSPGGPRRFNLWVLRQVSITANTFPSAHVAASLGATLALLRFAPAVGVTFLWVAASIAVATVRSRYHYGADAVFGTALAVLGFVLSLFLFPD